MVCQNLPCVGPKPKSQRSQERQRNGFPVLEPCRSPQETSTPRTLLPVSIRRPPNCPWRGKGGVRLSLPEKSTGTARPASPGLAPVPFRSAHRRSTRSSASSCQSSSRHRRSRSAWAAEPSGRKSLGPCERWGSFWDRERAARSSRALRKEETRGQSHAVRAAGPSAGLPTPSPRPPHGPCDCPGPKRAAPEHAPRRNLHGNGL